MTERRENPRQAMARPIKLRCDESGLRYLAGQTQDISRSGALIHLDHPALVLPGQAVEVMIAEQPRQAVLRRERLMRATVVRSLRHGDSQYVAVRFLGEQEMATAI